MNNKRNYQKELEKIIFVNRQDGKIPTLLLHCCCAPCSSYCLEYLSDHFKITAFYYNPNITDADEYRKREEELAKLVASQPHLHKVELMTGDYEPEKFFQISEDLETCPEGGERCSRCFKLRLRETAKRAAAGGFDYFTTTLTISPLKDAERLNRIGESLSAEYGTLWLPSDFKKKNGYRRSVELSGEYGLYRQNYCGCVYSVR